MKDKIMLKWLNKNMNKQDLFYFEDNDLDENIIDCYYKSGKHFAVFYREIIQKIIDEEIEIIN